MLKKISKYRQIIIYGLSLGFLVFLLKWMEYKFILISYSLEIYITLIALIFTGLGTWLALKLVKPKTETRIETVVVEKEVFRNSLTVNNGFIINEEEKIKLGISNREMEVLQLMAEGYSNQEIAEKLFVSLNTIKTHSSKVFEKLEVKRRTQAVEKAKRLQIIA
jgi:two-component system, NarL family, response regulator LiaR